jgi:hypothetical protein
VKRVYAIEYIDYQDGVKYHFQKQVGKSYPNEHYGDMEDVVSMVEDTINGEREVTIYYINGREETICNVNISRVFREPYEHEKE